MSEPPMAPGIDELAERRARQLRDQQRSRNPHAPQTPTGLALAELVALTYRQLRELAAVDPEEAERVNEFALALITARRRDITT